MNVTKRAFIYALTRPKVLTLAAVSAGLLFWGAPPTAAGIVLAVAVFKVARILSYEDIDERLRLRERKVRNGVRRMLRPSERDEILALDHYATLLRDSGAEPSLAEETLDEAFRIVRECGPHDASARLAVFRHGLPPLRSSGPVAPKGRDVAAKIERELALLRATERELELVRGT